MRKTKLKNTMRETREKLDISQTELAERLGLTQVTISRIECGKIAFRQLHKLALERLEQLGWVGV